MVIDDIAGMCSGHRQSRGCLNLPGIVQTSRDKYDYISTRAINTEYILICCIRHYSDVIMGAIAPQITSLTIVYSTVYSDADQRQHQSSASLAFVRGIHRRPVNSPHKWPITRKMFPFDDVIMEKYHLYQIDLISFMCTEAWIYNNINDGMIRLCYIHSVHI